MKKCIHPGHETVGALKNSIFEKSFRNAHINSKGYLKHSLKILNQEFGSLGSIIDNE